MHPNTAAVGQASLVLTCATAGPFDAGQSHRKACVCLNFTPPREGWLSASLGHRLRPPSTRHLSLPRDRCQQRDSVSSSAAVCPTVGDMLRLVFHDVAAVRPAVVVRSPRRLRVHAEVKVG